MAKVVLAAESGADIPEALAKEYGIFVLPMHVTMGEKNLDDGKFPTGDVFDYYKKTRRLPTTSAVNPEEYEKGFQKIHEEDPECRILHLCYSAVTTATYQNSLIGSEGMDYVTHVDTKSVSAGQGCIALKAARYLREHPEAEMEEVLEQVNGWISRVQMAFVPSTLVYLRAGGRVSNAAYLGATVLNLKPVIEILDGYLVCKKKFRGSMERVCRRLIDEMAPAGRLEPDTVYMIYSQGLSPEIMREAELEMGRRGYENVPWFETGCVISTHGGPGAFGVGGIGVQ